MRKKVKCLLGLVLAMLICCSIALASTANASSRKYMDYYLLTVTGSKSSITCFGESNEAWSNAYNDASSTYYVKSLTTKCMNGSTEVSSSYNNGSISSKSYMSGTHIGRNWSNSNYKYVHNLKITTNYNNQIMTDDLTMTVIQN